MLIQTMWCVRAAKRTPPLNTAKTALSPSAHPAREFTRERRRLRTTSSFHLTRPWHREVKVEVEVQHRGSLVVRSIRTWRSTLTAAQTSSPSAPSVSLTPMLATKLRDWRMWCRDSRRKSPSWPTRFVFPFSFSFFSFSFFLFFFFFSFADLLSFWLAE